MSKQQQPRVKICCISSVEEARLAIQYGASALGLVSEMPSGPGPIAESLIAEIVSIIPPGVASFLLTCKQTPDEVIAQQRRTRANTIQLVDTFPAKGYSLLHQAMPGVKIVQVVHVLDESSLIEAQSIEKHIDGFLFDSGNPSLAIKELGGTGRVHNWDISRKIREAVSIPVFLAGGINASNVCDAIETVQPFGVDLCSGVRTNGKLDEEKLAAFFRAVKSCS